MEYKEHKKMYKVGKKWVVATLVSASVLMGGVLDAHADQTTPSNNGVAAQTERSAASQSSTANQNSSADNDSNLDNNQSGTPVQTADQTANATGEASSADAGQTQLKRSTNSANADSEAAQKNLAKLNPAAAQAVKDAKINAASLTDEQINELNKINFSQSAEKGAKLTFKDLEGIGHAIINQNPQYAIPYFNARQIKNMPAAYAVDAQTGKMAKLDVWDSWPVQDPVTGYVSNYHGYQLVIAMMGIPNSKYGDNHIYLLYNKYGDNDFSHWRNAGSIFGDHENNVFQEWSGSAIVNKDGSIQLFYTSNDTSDYKLNDQKLATATLHLNVDDNGISIKSVDNNHILFEGDGYHYQNYQQFATGADRKDDDYCLRDPHVVQLSNGDRYLVFEANTGTEDYQNDSQIYNWANYGGDAAFNLKSFFKFLNDKKDRTLAGVANGALGILKLTDNQTDPQVQEVYSPLVSSLMASDEVERPDVVKLGDKYYLFSVTRVSRGSDTELTDKDNAVVGDNVAMIGYVADNLTGPYKPLNQSGVVLTASVPANWRTATYSYYAVPVEGHPDQVLVTSYMSNKDFASGEGNYATWAPSFLVQINPDATTTVLARATNQGDWVWDASSENNNMLGVLNKDATNSACLPGEWGKPIDWHKIGGGYGLIPHQGAEPSTKPTDKPGNNPQPGNKPGTKPGNQPANTPGQQPGNAPQTAPQPQGHNSQVMPSAQPTSNAKELPQTGNAKGELALATGTFLAMLGLVAVEKRRSN